MPSDRLEQLSLLVRAERGALSAVARAEGMSPEEALECVQEALSTFLSRPEPIADEHMVASLKTIVRNAARNARRKHARLKQHVPLEGPGEPVAERADVEDLVSHAEEVVRLRLCVAELCDIQRAVVTLRLLEERSGEDVAELLGVSRNYVDVLVHRARSALHVCMRVPQLKP
ncbi:MAG: sigma-70 family RNA polymerase sigma factor [Myxococcales bacterium]